MKKVLMLILVAVSFMSCEPEVILPGGPGADSPGTILGRWIPEGFESNVRYEFTSEKRHTIYGDGSGEFPSLQDWVAENPGILEHDYVFQEDVVVIDLNFGNYSRLIPTYKCENLVIEWVNEAGETHSTFYREGHDIENCN